MKKITFTALCQRNQEKFTYTLPGYKFHDPHYGRDLVVHRVVRVGSAHVPPTLSDTAWTVSDYQTGYQLTFMCRYHTRKQSAESVKDLYPKITPERYAEAIAKVIEDTGIINK